MGRLIHARRRGDSFVFREWSSIVDAYTTGGGDEEGMRAYLLDDYSPRDVREGRAEREISGRLSRAKEKGCSSMDDERHDLDGPWETERCEGPNGCGGFHHAFKRRLGDGACSECGEPESDRQHGEPCVSAGAKPGEG